MHRLFSSFLKGLLFLLPLLLTFYVLYFIFIKIDGILELPIPGLGFLLTLLFVLLVGELGSNIFFSRIFSYFESLVTRLPLVKLLYFSIKDLTGAFVGEKKGFTRPVVVDLDATKRLKVLGFVTAETLELPGCEEHVAVYLPQSYNFAANLILVPRDQVHPLPPSESAGIMAFIVSGGVSEGAPRGYRAQRTQKLRRVEAPAVAGAQAIAEAPVVAKAQAVAGTVPGRETAV